MGERCSNGQGLGYVSVVFQLAQSALFFLVVLHTIVVLKTFFTVFYGSFTAGWRASQVEHHHFVILLIEQLLAEDISEVHYSLLSILNNGLKHIQGKQEEKKA